MSVPREMYVNVVFDTSDAAAAWLGWVTAHKLLVNVTYAGIRLKSFINMESPDTRIMVMGMCDARRLDAPWTRF
jgi:hypothetical protein